MQQKILLIDFENVQQVKLSLLDDSFYIFVFIGATQKNIPIELVLEAQRRKGRVVWQRLESCGTNALDFFITYWLGRIFAKFPQTQCCILSQDKGFDPLIQNLQANGFSCMRVGTLSDLAEGSSQKAMQSQTNLVSGPTKILASPSSQPQAIKHPLKSASKCEDPSYTRVVQLLKKAPDISRPRKRATLSKHVSSMFRQDIAPSEVERIINKLAANKVISEANNHIVYSL